MKNISDNTTKLPDLRIPDLRNGVLGSLSFSKPDRSLAGKMPVLSAAPLLFTH
jgi:hypothetical protein